MTTFDIIVRGGTVVNHAGEGRGDIGVTGGRIAAIGDLSRASAGDRRSMQRVCTCCPA